MQKRVCVLHSRNHVYYSLIESAPKTITLQTVLSVLNTVRATDIAKTVASLDPVTQDNLMKYIYKGMASVEEGGNCATLLNWHEKVGDQRLPGHAMPVVCSCALLHLRYPSMIIY